MKREHEMPFGAHCCENGTVRFRLWAPKAESVAVRLIDPSLRESPQCELEMPRVDGGWFELSSRDAKAGTNYQFIIDGQHAVPDPASRYQPSGVYGASEVIEPGAFEWHDVNWRGMPWEESIIYELHVGTFSPQGTYAGAEEKLDYLAGLRVTAVELMPLSSFPGQRNWGYDGVLAYAPTQVYGRPEELKQLIESAHARNLMVFLDVVYNHFGPEGNYLHLFAPQFFTNCRHTPWGPAINFDGPKSRAVRDFFIHNALYWLEEFHFDGLRLDAVHAIVDDSRPDILTELSETVRNRFGSERQIHLILENDHNAAHYLCDGNGRDTGGRINPGRGLAVRDADASLRQGHPPLYDAQWNDDIHHAMQVLLTGESSRYYMDYAANPIQHLGRCLAEGFSYQGEVSRFRNGALRGEPSRDLPPTRFVSFLQNHDQVGNRALGERIVEVADLAAIKVVSTVFLLAPSPPLIFMGEEFAAATPFLFFCDFGPDLAAKVSEGRRKEFPDFTQRDSSCLEIPDPNDEKTFLRSKLDWASALELHRADWLKFYQGLLRVRREEIVPRIREIVPGRAEYKAIGTCGLRVRWALRRGGYLEVVANFGRSPLNMDEPLEGRLLCGTLEDLPTTPTELPSHTAVWLLA